jgi:hypothetical protein
MRAPEPGPAVEPRAAPDPARRRERLFGRARAAALFGLAAWFCGNAYEQVVIVPNLAFGDARAAMVAFRAFFWATNPALYYVPLGPLVLVSTALCLSASWRDPLRRRHVSRALWAVVLAMLLTAYVVRRINLRLFFGPVLVDAAVARALARQWLALNLARMALAAGAFALVLRSRPRA